MTTRAGRHTVEIALPGLDCAEDAQEIQRAAGALPGVMRVDVLRSARKAVVTFDPAVVDPRAIHEAIEQVCLPLFGATLDAARVTSGTRLLDAGCGAGLLALLASFRGAQVAALDASPGLLAIARQRLPGADVREGDLEALPFADASFDAAAAVNSVF